MSNRESLLPCPFCGEGDSVTTIEEKTYAREIIEDALGDYALEDNAEAFDENIYGYRVRCSKCFANGLWGDSRVKAGERWNARAGTIHSVVYRESGRIENHFLANVEENSNEE